MSAGTDPCGAAGTDGGPGGAADEAPEGGAAGFAALLGRFTAAVETGDGPGLAACFTADGTYVDYLYGPFQGRAAIARMLVDHFHGDARDFRWEMLDPVCDGRHGYAHYRFSFTSAMAGSAGRRVAVDGIAHLLLRDGLIERYTEVVNGGIAMAQLGHAPERMAKVFARWSERLLSDPGFASHRARESPT